VGDEAGHAAEILTVHAAKGLEYPIVVLADVLATSMSRDKAFLDHQTGEGWLKIGSAEPPGFGERRAIERRRADAEERRLLYVAVTRACDHLVVPVLPLERQKPVSRSWAQPVLGALAPAGEPAWSAIISARDAGDATFTCIDSRGYFPAPNAEGAPRPAQTLEGDAAARETAAVAARAWEEERRRCRDAGRARSGPETVAATDLAKETGQLALPLDSTSAAFGTLVHRVMARCALDGSDLEDLAARLAPELGLDAAAAGEAAARARSTLEQPLFDRVRQAPRVLREVPLQATLDGQRVRGIVDLAFRDGDGWTLVEFKTGADGRGAAAQEQARLYGRAFQQAAGGSVRVEVWVVGSSS
jgi:ATP-dependent helicase/nuclease subunit A